MGLLKTGEKCKGLIRTFCETNPVEVYVDEEDVIFCPLTKQEIATEKQWKYPEPGWGGRERMRKRWYISTY